MSDHSAKRQRLDSIGRFSPASPPFDVAAKASGQTAKTPIHPRTPTSPPYSSMNSQSNGGFSTTSTATSSDRSPQSSVPMSQSLEQSATSASIQHPFPTPASTAGFLSSANVDSDGDATMEESADDDAAPERSHRLSNHNRQRESAYTQDGRLRAAQGISGSQLFKLNTEKIETSRPHASQNFITLYRLEPLASSVARNDPVTGEKINKLRKSYEGHIKQMQIAGKPKATKMDGVFRDLLMLPEEIWQPNHVQNREPHKTALTPDGTALTPDFSQLLDGAFAGMGPGSLPNADANKYKAYLGTDDTAKPKAQEAPPQRPTSFTSSTGTPNSQFNTRGVPRPERSGSKRAYTDAAFQGYGEGFGDDYADSTGGEDTPGGNMANKRRKLQFERTSHSVEVGGARR
ncbi:Rox3-domain-containing protein [Stemphylium lycopersici]|nr:Rox3-domain-containing protein [Stemphylium lycopersici]